MTLESIGLANPEALSSQNSDSADVQLQENGIDSNGSPFDEDLLNINVEYDDDILNDAGKPLDSIGLANPDALSPQNSDSTDVQLQESNEEKVEVKVDDVVIKFLG